ncbi:MAG: hypothetical protein AAFU83_01260 [Bacteroidota bacterium]
MKQIMVSRKRCSIILCFSLVACGVTSSPEVPPAVSGIRIDIATTIDPKYTISICSETKAKDEESDLVSRLREYVPNINATMEEKLAVDFHIPSDNQRYSDSENEREDEERTTFSRFSKATGSNKKTQRKHIGSENGPSYNLTKKRKLEWQKAKVDNYIRSHAQISALKDLAQDALQIAASTQGSLEYTTILCVALMNSKQRVKKFAFHNGTTGDWRKPDAENANSKESMAHELGYHLIQSQQSHAEGQFLQFLYQRCKQNPGYYTYIVGIGCSRRHCFECDFLLQLILGESYRKITSVTKIGDPEKAIIESATEQAPLRLVTKRRFSIATIDDCSPNSFSQLCSSDKSNKFYIPRLLREVIEKHIEASIETSGERYGESR